MAEASILLMEELLYPTLEVRTNPKHDVQGTRSGTLLKFGQQVQPIENQPGKYGLVVSVATDDEKSQNPPYKFIVEAYAIVTVGGEKLEGDALAKFITENGLPIVMGAIREHLAHATARAPWGRFLINAVPLPNAVSILTV